MNKQMMYTIRILLGGFLAFIGIRLLIQITDQRPTNTVPLGLFAGVVIIVGAVDALFSFRKLWLMLRPEDSAPDAGEDGKEYETQEQSAAKRRKKPAMVKITDPKDSDEGEEEEKKTDPEEAENGLDHEETEEEVEKEEQEEAEEEDLDITEADESEGGRAEELSSENNSQDENQTEELDKEEQIEELETDFEER